MIIRIKWKDLCKVLSIVLGIQLSFDKCEPI